MSLNFTKSLFFIIKLLKKKLFFIPIFVYKILKKLFTNFRDEKRTFLKFRNKNKLLTKFRDQNSILFIYIKKKHFYYTSITIYHLNKHE